MKKSILLFVAPFLIASCSHRVKSELNRLDQELETNPTYVLSQLDSIDSQSLKGNNAAMYAFLKTSASYMVGMENISDSIARIATDYWGGNRKGYRQSMGWYAQGLAYSSQKKDPEAIYALLKSKTLSVDTTTIRYATTNMLLGRHYYRRKLYDEALAAYNDAEGLYVNLNDRKAVAMCKFDMAVVHFEKKEYGVAKSMLTDLVDDENLDKDKSNSCKLYIAHILNATDGVAAGESILELANSYIDGCNNEEQAAPGYSLKGIALYYLHEPDSAFIYLEKSHSLTNDLDVKILAVRGLEQVAVQMKRFQAAWNAEILNKDYQSEQDKQYSQSEITQIRLQHNDEIQKQKYRSSVSRIVLIGVMLLIVVISLIIITIIRRERNLKAYYLEKHDEFIKKQIQEKTDSEGGKLSQACESFRSGMAFNMINDVAMQHRTFKLEERDVVVHDINLYFADQIAALKNEAGKLGQQEVTFIFCTVLGIDQDVVADIMCTSRSNMRSIKSRLKSKIGPDSFALYFKE